MVDLLDGRHASFLEATLTQGVLCCVAVTDTLPRSAVGFVDVGASLVLVVTLAFRLLMGGAILSVG